MTWKIYVATFRYSLPEMAEVIVSKETDKTFSVASYTEIMGYFYAGRLLRKDGLHWFDTPAEALAWCIEAQREYVNKKQEEANDAGRRLQELLEMQA